MSFALSLFFFIFGLLAGSFLNVVIFRFPELKGIFFGRSKCPHCKKEIAFFDLIPLVSYLLLWGKCRNCRGKISLQYPAVELATGILFFALFLHFGLTVSLFLHLALFSLFIIIFVYDTKFLEIPETIAWLALILAIITPLFSSGFNLSTFLLGGLTGGGILGILVGISDERWMGSGDIKIGLAFGFLLGFEKTLLFLLLSFIIGAMVGVVLMIFSNKKIKSEIAFSPFLIIAGIIALFWGDSLLNFYLKFVIM